MAKTVADGETLFEGDDARREALLVRFEDRWRQHGDASIEDFLRDDDPQRFVILTELVHIDLECRIKSGQPCSVESYFQRYPELRRDEDLALDLIQTEFRLLHDSGRKVAVDDFTRRFPEFAERLKQRLGVVVESPQAGFPVQLQCPHCRGPIAIMEDNRRAEIRCPSCDNTVRLDTDLTVSWQTDRLAKLGKFELEQDVGRGAFGTVYRAHDTDLERTVAVKVPRTGTFRNEEEERRFIREARSAARLSHPNIVRVHEVGRADGLPYIVTEFVDGVTLADALKGRPFSISESVLLTATMADALQHAHEAGVVHRDLKPSNIMLTSRGEVRIMDFGLAKRDAGDATATADGQLIGTPAYMSPEQARGKGHLADKRTDIYGLGVILFELLTGQRPFSGNSSMLVYQVVHEDAPRPRGIKPEIPSDLETICLRCLEKDPDDRFQSAGELANELRRFHGGEPIQTARRPSGVWAWCQKHPTLITGLCGLLVALFLLVFMNRPADQRDPRVDYGSEPPRENVPQDIDGLAIQATAQLERILHRDNPGFVSKVDQLATRIAAVLKDDLEHSSIAIGRFSGQPQLQDRSGQLIEALLIGALSSRGIVCTRRSEVSCKGDYAFDPDHVCVEFNVRVLRKSDTIKVLRETLSDLEEDDDLVRFFDYLDSQH